MKGFVLEITILIIVCFIAELVMEGTRLEKSATKTLGIIITVSVCISVISLVFGIKNNSVPQIDFGADKNYIDQVNTQKINNIRSSIINEMDNNNVKNVKVYFSTSYTNNEISIDKIHIDLTSAEYNSSVTNINTIKEYVINTIKIDKENILVYF